MRGRQKEVVPRNQPPSMETWKAVSSITGNCFAFPMIEKIIMRTRTSGNDCCALALGAEQKMR